MEVVGLLPPYVQVECAWLEAVKLLFRRLYPIELAIRKATEDRRREVRLMAVAALNALLCGNVS